MKDDETVRKHNHWKHWIGKNVEILCMTQRDTLHSKIDIKVTKEWISNHIICRGTLTE